MFHHVIAVRHGGSETEILLDEQNGKALRLERADGLADLLNDDGSEPFGRLIEEQKPGPGPQDPADRQHLLLATGELGALAGTEPLLEIWKQIENAINGEAARFHDRRQQQIFLNVEAGEYSALLRAKRDACASNPIGRASDQLFSLKAHGSRPTPHDTHDRLERRGLACTIAPEQRNDFALVHVECHAMKNVGFAIPGLQVLDRKEGCANVKHAPLPCKPRALRNSWRQF